MANLGGGDSNKQFEALRRELEALFRATSRRCAEYAATAARELHLDRLAEKFSAEAKEGQDDEPQDKG